MKRFAFLLSSLLLYSAAVFGDGMPPRSAPSEYPASQTAKNASFGAIVIQSATVRKLFTDDIAKHYVVVEVAVYPEHEAELDIDSFDFSLSFGDGDMTRPDMPEAVASAWRERGSQGPLGSHGVTVETTDGIEYGSGRDPNTGQKVHGVTTYESVGVGVGNSRPPAPAPDASGRDPRVVEANLRGRALPEGKTKTAVAGYLYFPRPAKAPKHADLRLSYRKNGDAMAMPLPAK